MKKQLLYVSVVLLSANNCFGADVLMNNSNVPTATANGAISADVVNDYAMAVDGHTLFFPRQNLTIKLAGVDSCDVPQWSLNPKWDERDKVKAPQPVPCGALSKAWLKQIVDGQRVICQYSLDVGYCTVGKGRNQSDIGREMLFAGWAKIKEPVRNAEYYQVENNAKDHRRGMWATYVLNPDEWRGRAVDKTSTRQPIADFNLLKTRQSEISPPFVDARRRPRVTDQ